MARGREPCKGAGTGSRRPKQVPHDGAQAGSGDALVTRDSESAPQEPPSFPSKFRLRQSSPRSPNRSPPWTHLLSLAQVCSPTAQAIAATAQVQRRKWKMFMSRFRRRNHCYITRISTLLDPPLLLRPGLGSAQVCLPSHQKSSTFNEGPERGPLPPRQSLGMLSVSYFRRLFSSPYALFIERDRF